MRHAKVGLKSRLIAARTRLVRRFFSFGDQELLRALREVGIRDGDDLMLHSAFAPEHGYRGSIEQLTETFVRAVGPRGHLLMVSLPYRSSSLDYLRRLRSFDVRRAPSMMGLISEYFRRRADVLRSLHPTHPILVRGPDAAWYVARHDEALYPCGPGTPFDRLAQRNGLAAFYNVPFAAFTFFHYLEHMVRADLPFALYTEQPFHVPVIDAQGRSKTVTTYVFSPEAIVRRRFEVLEQALRRRGAIKAARVGNSRIEAVRVRDAIDCVRELASRGQWFYALDAAAQPRAPHATRGD